MTIMFCDNNKNSKKKIKTVTEQFHILEAGCSWLLFALHTSRRVTWLHCVLYEDVYDVPLNPPTTSPCSFCSTNAWWYCTWFSMPWKPRMAAETDIWKWLFHSQCNTVHALCSACVTTASEKSPMGTAHPSRYQAGLKKSSYSTALVSKLSDSTVSAVSYQLYCHLVVSGLMSDMLTSLKVQWDLWWSCWHHVVVKGLMSVMLTALGGRGVCQLCWHHLVVAGLVSVMLTSLGGRGAYVSYANITWWSRGLCQLCWHPGTCDAIKSQHCWP